MNYMGSKSKLAQHLLPIMLHNRKEGQYFVDLFCGGCNLVDKVNGLRIANDKNIYLIDMFKALVNNEKLPLSISKELYDDVKNDYDTKGGKYSNAEIGWIGFMASFKGKFFNGYCGDASDDRNYITEHINNILYQVPLLKGIEFHSGNYSDVEIPDNAIIYCDIPYKHTTKYKGADSFDYDKFYDYVRNFTYRGGANLCF